MHIHELNPRKTMVTMVLFIIVIIVGLITLRKPRVEYQMNPTQIVELVTYGEGMVYPWELEDILSGTIDTVVLVDIRNTFQYGRGHIEGAENISAVELLSEDNLERLKDLKKAGETVLIYGNTLVEANGPFMVLRQIGLDNVKVLMGGYDYYKTVKDNLGDSYGDDTYELGIADHNFTEVAASAKSAGEDTNNDSPEPVQFTRKAKAKVAEGGC